MDIVKIGKRTFGLGPAYMEPKVEKAMEHMEKQFKPRRQLIYFWDCENKSGVPNPRPANFAALTQVGIQMFDPNTGKPDPAETKLARQIYARAILGSKRGDIRKIVNKAVPPVKVPIPYSLIDPYRDDFHVKMYAKFKPMFYLAYLLPKGKGAAGPGSDYMWLIMARDFEFEIKLISRCDGKAFDLPKDWSGKRAGYPLLDEIQQLRMQADEHGRKEMQKAKKEGNDEDGK